MKLSVSCVALVLCATVAWRASAQPAVEQEAIADLDLYYTSIDMPRGHWRLLARGSLGGGYRLGTEPSRLVQGDADVLLGATSGQTTVLKLRSRLSAIADLHSGDEGMEAQPTIGGRHRFLLRHGIGGFQEGDTDDLQDKALGADLVAEGYADHGRIGMGAVRYDAGAGRYASVGGEAGVWLRRAIGSGQAMTMPVRGRYGATQLASRAGVLGGWSHRYGADVGWGIKHYFEYDYHGYVEALGVAWDRFEPVAGAQVDRLELRALHLDDVVFRDRFLFNLGDQYLFFVRTWIGAHWLMAQRGERSHSIFAFETALGARFPFEKAHGELHIAGGREAAPTGYSGQMADRYRLESRASMVMRQHGIGGDTKVVSAWQRNTETDGDFVQQLGVSSSLWFDPFDKLSVGVYQRALLGQPQDGDAFELDDRWRHDVGLFIRFRGGERGGERMKAGAAGFSPF